MNKETDRKLSERLEVMRSVAAECAKLRAIVTELTVQVGQLQSVIAALTEPAVHALDCGMPVCGFTYALPRDWPAGHTFVNRHGEGPERVTCELCRHAMNLQALGLA